MLFLADADHGGHKKAKWTRQMNLPSAAVSLLVGIGLYLYKCKETAALKLKAAAL